MLFIMSIAIVIGEIVLFFGGQLWCYNILCAWSRTLHSSFMWFWELSRLHWPELSLVVVWLRVRVSQWFHSAAEKINLNLTKPQLDPAGLNRANGDEAKVFLCELRGSSTLPAFFHQFGSLFDSYLCIVWKRPFWIIKVCFLNVLF